jgi:hypothetical protein
MNENEANGKGKDYTIVVNGTQQELQDEIVTYEEVVRLAFPVVPSSESRFDVIFSGAKEPKQGSLKAGGKIEIKKQGTIFHVSPTIKS